MIGTGDAPGGVVGACNKEEDECCYKVCGSGCGVVGACDNEEDGGCCTVCGFGCGGIGGVRGAGSTFAFAAVALNRSKEAFTEALRDGTLFNDASARSRTAGLSARTRATTAPFCFSGSASKLSAAWQRQQHTDSLPANCRPRLRPKTQSRLAHTVDMATHRTARTSCDMSAACNGVNNT